MTTPTIFLTLPAWLTIRAAVQYNPKLEVSGWGKVVLDEDRFLVTDVYIPPQEVGGAHIEFQPADLNPLYQHIIERGEQGHEWRFWWHSHASMGTSPSGTDHNTMKQLAAIYSGHGVGDWACGAVFNAKDEATGFVGFKHPLWDDFSTETIKVVTAEYRDPAIEKQVAEWMKDVHEKVYVPQQAQGAIRSYPLGSTGYGRGTPGMGMATGSGGEIRHIPADAAPKGKRGKGRGKKQQERREFTFDEMIAELRRVRAKLHESGLNSLEDSEVSFLMSAEMMFDIEDPDDKELVNALTPEVIPLSASAAALAEGC